MTYAAVIAHALPHNGAKVIGQLMKEQIMMLLDVDNEKCIDPSSHLSSKNTRGEN